MVGTSNVFGVVCARKGSKRLKDKNLLIINNQTLIKRAYDTLTEAGVNTWISTDYTYEQYPELASMNTYFRPSELARSDIPVQEAVFDLVLSRGWGYKIIAVLMPNGPFINSGHILRAIEMINNGCMIVRSYNVKDGKENGLYVMTYDTLMESEYIYDIYTGAIPCYGFEIHTKEDYAEAKRLFASNKALEGRCHTDY